jgi:hypothetical protein
MTRKMQFSSLVSLLMLVSLFKALAFNPSPILRRTTSASVRMAANGFAVVGVAGGAAETIACRLIEEGNSVVTILDREPSSPVIMAEARKNGGVYIAEDLEQRIVSVVPGMGTSTSVGSVLGGKVVIAVGDPGDDLLRGNGDGDDGFGRLVKKVPSPALPMLSKLAKALPDNIDSIVLSMGVSEDDDAMKSGFTPFGAPASSKLFREWCAEKGKSFSLFRYGKLSGGVTGNAPVPFVGLPTLDPELHPSYSLRSCVLTRPFGNLVTADSSDICTRDTLAEAIVQSVDRSSPVEALVLSTEGKMLSKNDWAKSFQRLSTEDSSQLLSLEFASVNKLKQLTSWVTGTWFPAAIIDSNAAVILSGARPVRAVSKVDGVVELVWETMTADLQVKPAGSLKVTITEQPPALTVTRSQAGALPGEVELVDNLVENAQQIYRKKLATPLE